MSRRLTLTVRNGARIEMKETNCSEPHSVQTVFEIVTPRSAN